MAERPILAIIPFPARLPVAAAILGALADVWERDHGQTLTWEHTAEESTPWGKALVIREPEPASQPPLSVLDQPQELTP